MEGTNNASEPFKADFRRAAHGPAGSDGRFGITKLHVHHHFHNPRRRQGQISFCISFSCYNSLENNLKLKVTDASLGGHAISCCIHPCIIGNATTGELCARQLYTTAGLLPSPVPCPEPLKSIEYGQMGIDILQCPFGSTVW